MLNIPWSVVYAIGALQILAEARGGLVPMGEVAKRGGFPAARLSKILQILRRGGLVQGTRGRGYALAKPPAEIDILTIVRVMEGGIGPSALCLMKRADCVFQNDCPMWHACRELSGRVLEVLSSVSIAGLPACGPVEREPGKMAASS